MITGLIHLRLPELIDGCLHQANADRRVLHALQSAPDGARVIVDIGDRSYITEEAARDLHEHDHRLHIEICGTQPEAVARFVRAARAGTWDVVL